MTPDASVYRRVVRLAFDLDGQPNRTEFSDGRATNRGSRVEVLTVPPSSPGTPTGRHGGVSVEVRGSRFEVRGSRFEVRGSLPETADIRLQCRYGYPVVDPFRSGGAPAPHRLRCRPPGNDTVVGRESPRR